MEKKNEKEGKDSKDRELGKHFEDLFKKLLEINRIDYIPKDGEHDFIVYPETDKKIR